MKGLTKGKSTSWGLHDEMNRLEGENLDSIRPVLASGAVFVFIFTFQFYRYFDIMPKSSFVLAHNFAQKEL